MKKTIQFLWTTFCMICTCVLTVVAIFTTLLNPTDSVEPKLLWQILLVSLLCTLSTLYKFGRKKSKFSVCVIFHYILINAIVLISGALFEWYRPDNFESLIKMLISITVTYVIISVISWRNSVREAKELNEKLAQYQEQRFPANESNP